MFINILGSIWFAGISLVAIPANVLVMIVIFKNKKRFDYYHLLLVLQGFRDILFNIVVNLYTVATIANEKIIFGQTECRFVAFLSRVWYFGTALTLSAVTIERYNSIKNCLNHNGNITKKRVLVVIVMYTLMPIAAALPLALGKTRWLHLTTLYGCQSQGLDVNHTEVLLYGSCLLVVFLVFPSVFLIKTSVNMFILVRRHTTTILNTQPGEIVPSVEQTQNSRENRMDEPIRANIRKAHSMKIAKNVLLVNSGFLVSLLPIFILKLVSRLADSTFTSTPKIIILIVYWLNYCCTVWSPVINALRRNDLRREARKVLTNFIKKITLSDNQRTPVTTVNDDQSHRNVELHGVT